MFPIDHDLHCHTHLSGCSNDPGQTIANILAHAKAFGYVAQCFTDHFWDAPYVPGSKGTYLDGQLEKRAALLMTRLEALLELPLPWEKVGIAHLNCPHMFRGGDLGATLRAVPEDRFRAAMGRYAQLGAGIELNLSCFSTNIGRPDVSRDDNLRLFLMAKDEGCRFFLASDAHHPKSLDIVPRLGPDVVAALGLGSRHLYRLPTLA